MGRPPSENPRSARVVLRVLPEEHDRWMRGAARAKLTLSAWLRELADNAAPPPAPKAKRGKP